MIELKRKKDHYILMVGCKQVMSFPGSIEVDTGELMIPGELENLEVIQRQGIKGVTYDARGFNVVPDGNWMIIRGAGNAQFMISGTVEFRFLRQPAYAVVTTDTQSGTGLRFKF